jgi:hypothetical protein
MTEVEWLTEPHGVTDSMIVADMTDFIASVGSERKLRLFTHACCQRIENLLVNPCSRSALAALARYADGECDKDELGVHWSGALAAKQAIEEPLCQDGCLYSTAESIAAGAICYASNPIYAGAFRKPYYHNSTVSAAANAALVATGSVAYSHTQSRSDSEAAQSTEAVVQSLLLHDIFGNPFRPVTFPPAWRTITTVALAKLIHESRDFGAMPILADALQDAGCEDADILNHCRDVSATHVRGCWVVDLVLGKE